MASSCDPSTPALSSPLRIVHAYDTDVSIYDLTAAKVGEVCPIIKKEALKPISLIEDTPEMQLFRYGHLLPTCAVAHRIGDDLETPQTARSTCSIFLPPNHDYNRVYQARDGEGDSKAVQTPITARSTCSVFFPPATPGTGKETDDMDLTYSNDRAVRVKFFGYEPEYPFTLNFHKLKNLNGYEKGMLSAPLYPSILEKDEIFSRYFPESCTSPYTESGDEQVSASPFDTTAIANISSSTNHKESSDSSSESEEDRSFSVSEGRSSTAPSIAGSSNPTSPTSSTGSNVPRIVVTPPQNKQNSILSPPCLAPVPKRKGKKPAAVCGGYSVYKNSLPLRNWQASTLASTLSPVPVSTSSDEQVKVDSNREDANDNATKPTAITTTAISPETKEKGKAKSRNGYHYINYSNANWSQSQKDEYSRALRMFYAQGRALAATQKAIAWCEQQRSHNEETNSNIQPPQPSRREVGESMVAFISHRINSFGPL